LSYKVSVDSIADADADDVLAAFIDILFKQNSIRSWVFFGLGLFIPFCLSTIFWLNGQFLAAAVFSATALLVVIGRIIGLSGEKPAEGIEQPEELQAQV